MHRLIVNADDFGLSSSINRGIIRGHEEGIVTATSLSANGKCFLDAVRYLKDHPSLDVGIHFTLVGECSLQPPSRIPSLVDGEGKFRKDVKTFFLDYLRGAISVDEMKLELSAQAGLFADYGIRISHADSHQHVHMLPGILKVVLQICRNFGIRHLRRPAEPIRFRNLIPPNRILRFLQQIVLNAYCRAPGTRAPEFTVDNFYGFLDGGNLSRDRVLGILDDMPEGTTELMCHPSVCEEGGSGEKHSQWKYHGDTELACLVDEEIRDRISMRNIQLVCFRDLQERR